MLKKEDILNALDNCQDEYYDSFVSLGHPYSYLIDARLNVFKYENEWAIVVERLGYNPRGGYIDLEIHYYGNCLINLEEYNGKPTNYYLAYPIDLENFEQSVDGETLKPDADFWLVRGQQVDLSHNKQDYANAGIELDEYEPNQIRAEEAGRLVITKHQDLFRATDQELYKCIPAHLKKILVLDEWYHRDFLHFNHPPITDEQMRAAYALNTHLNAEMDFPSFVDLIKKQEIQNKRHDTEEWENNRPSSYETWQLIAEVIVTGNPDVYQPTIAPNTDWRNWPESGSL